MNDTGFVISRCQTACDDDCNAPCHESHTVPSRRHHNAFECEAGQRRWAQVQARTEAATRRLEAVGWYARNGAIGDTLAILRGEHVAKQWAPKDGAA